LLFGLGIGKLRDLFILVGSGKDPAVGKNDIIYVLEALFAFPEPTTALGKGSYYPLFYRGSPPLVR